MNPDLIFEKMTEQWRERRPQELLRDAMMRAYQRALEKHDKYLQESIIKYSQGSFVVDPILSQLWLEEYEIRHEQRTYREKNTVHPQ